MQFAHRRLALLALSLALFLFGCSGGEPGDTGVEDVGSVSQATTQTCFGAPLAGECRYEPVQAWASSVEGNSSAYQPSAAIDHDCTTRWSSAFSDPQWLKVDLGRARTLSRVLIHWETSASSNYDLQVSDNTVDWTTIATKANATITGSGNSRVDTLSGLTATARYLRVYSKARTTSYGNSVFELEIFGTSCNASCSQIPVFPVGAAASSSENSEKGPEKAIDGLSSTRWSSAFSDPQWLRLDLGSSQSVTRVVLDWENASSSKYEIGVSDSTSGPWKVLRTVQDSRLGARTDDVTGLAATGRYIRINSLRRSTSYGNSLFEVKLFRESCDQCEQILVPTQTTASSKESDTYAPSKATDGDYTTRWSSQFSDPQWLLLDFGAARRLNKLILKWEGAASRTYRVEGSTLATGPWQLITQQTNMPAGPRVDLLKDLNATARFVRIYSTARTTSYGISLYEAVPIGNADPQGCGACALGDTDKDGTSDCTDLCSRDPAKTAPGACGCGNLETDSDHDGTPDCIDICKLDPNNVAVGQCGCDGLPGLAAAGTPCSDGPCGAGVCNGAGVCGSTSCAPEPNCVLKPNGASSYWFCPAATFQQAVTRCQAIEGRRLVRIDDAGENDFIARNVTGNTWLGGNDRATEGTWRWLTDTGVDGDTFWKGNTNAPGYLFNAWSSGGPATPDCAAIGTGAGTWQARDCGEALPYVCEKSTRSITGTGPTTLDWCKFFPAEICHNLDQQPVQSTKCVDQATVLPTTFQAFEDQVNECLKCKTAGQDCSQFCKDAATPPPADAVCQAWSGENAHACGMTDVDTTRECTTDAECGAGFVCRLHYDCQRCDDDGNCSNEFCPGKMRCGKPVPNCTAPFDTTQPCGDVEICTTPDVVGDSNPEHDPDTDLVNEPVTPSLFQGATPAVLPEAYADPEPPCSASPCGIKAGKGHPWCTLGTEGTLPPKTADDGKQGKSGGDSGIVQFDFDPNMDLTYATTPLPFGISKYDLSATASFQAKARFAFLGIRPEVEIVDAAAKVVANICKFSTDGTKLEVFGHDFLPEILGRSPAFDSNDVFPGKDCETALENLQVLMNRAKKAMKDAQELIRQYKALRDNGQEFASGFCQAIAGDPEAGFPVGNCSTETARDTIDRFRQHYVNQVNKLQAELEGLPKKILSSATLPPEWRGIKIGGPGSEESQLIVNVPFAIGPIPMKLEVEAFMSYGVDGSINFEFAPSGLFTTGKQNVARVTANAIPNANAGIRVFVGAGIGVNGFDASIGVEGSVTLGNVSVPIWAGAGIDVGAEPDSRTLAQANTDVSSGILFPPGGAKQYRFFFNYTYGANVSVTDILKGNLAGRVRIKFFFFSKTWRKIIASFPGLGRKDFVLFKGEGGASTGSFPWGVTRLETPFLNLVLPSTPPGQRPPDAPATVPFDPARAEELFYDSLCTCQPVNQPCSRGADCCDDVPFCFGDPAQGGKKVCSGSCRAGGQTCNVPGDCCANAPKCLVEPNSNGVGHCSACKDDGVACSADSDCCGNACVNNKCTSCLPFGEACQGRAAGCCTKNPNTSEKLNCVTLTTNPVATCWCQADFGGCSNETSSWQCCNPQAACQKNQQGVFLCIPPGPA